MECIRKDIPPEILFDIKMESYMIYNSQIASMYDYLGEIYSLQDIKDIQQAQKDYEERCINDYLDGKRIYTEEDIKKIKESWCI